MTGPLVQWGEKELVGRAGITAADYGTARVLTGSAGATLCLKMKYPLLVEVHESMRQVMIEFLTGACSGQYEDMGMCFYTHDEVTNSTTLQCFRDALSIIAWVPSLQRTVMSLVRACHVLKPENDAYDVSHSDPRLPFSVFISVPKQREPTDALRVAESLVHEAMHLQLTLIERILPLVKESNLTYYSPWKGRQRPVQGILHAMYVFRVIDNFFERLLAFPGSSTLGMDHMRMRRDVILRQVLEVKEFKDHQALTEAGTLLVEQLVSV